MIFPEDDPTPAIVAQRALRGALIEAPLDREKYKTEIQNMDHELPPDTLPRFPSGCQKLDFALGGGWYGMSAIVGPQGVGKTLLSFRSGIEAAKQPGTRAVIFAGEQDRDSFAARWDSYQENALDSRLADAVDFLSVIHVPFGWSPEHLVWDFEASCDLEDERFLFIMDSINTIADKNIGQYLERLKLFMMLALNSRIAAPGICNWLIISETNQRGQAKGGKLEYWCDNVLKIKGQKGDGFATLSLSKTRHGGEADFGKMVKHWNRQTFVTEFEAPYLVAADGEPIL